MPADRRRAAGAATASPSTSSASDDEHRAAVEQRRPQLLALAGPALVVQRGEAPDDRQHRVGGVGHPEAEVERRVAGVHRPGLVLEPGRRLEQRVEAAEVRERALEPVRPGVAVDDVGVDRACSPRTRCRAASRRRRSCCGARCRPARRAASAIFVAGSRLDVERDVALAALSSRRTAWFTMRMPSPVTGSTLMTSAPRSPRIIGPNGPARYWPKSTTTTPSSACISCTSGPVNAAISSAE